MKRIRYLVSRVGFVIIVLVVVSGLLLITDITRGIFLEDGARFNVLSKPTFSATRTYYGTEYVPIDEQEMDLTMHLPFYGVHYAPIDELETIKELGVEIVLMDFEHDGPSEDWLACLDEAQAQGIQVVAWLWPEGWSWDGSEWQIDDQAGEFIQTVAGHPALLAVHTLHEPYWMDCEGCGYTTAEQQAHYNAIKAIADVPIWSAVDSIAFWTAQGAETAFADGVCDYCETWYYPFKEGGIYEREELIAQLTADLRVARDLAPNSKIVWGMQSIAQGPPYNLRMPTADEMRDLASVVYSTDIDGALWYVWYWDNDLYSDFLSNHPELRPLIREIYENVVLPVRN